MEAPARPHRRLIWKYTVVVVTLVAAAIVSVGLTELYFSYQDSKRALTRVEQDKASAAATSITSDANADVPSRVQASAPSRPTGDSAGDQPSCDGRPADQHELDGLDHEWSAPTLPAGGPDRGSGEEPSRFRTP